MDAKKLKVVFPADGNLVSLGAEVRGLDKGETYVVGSRELCMDEQGKLIIELTLRPAKPGWIKWLDTLSLKYAWLPQVIALVVLVILGGVGLCVFSWLSEDHDVPLALAGRAIVVAPWAIPIICMVAAFRPAWRARRRIGLTFVYVLSFVALTAGVGLGLLWHALFVPVWPTDYVRLASTFSQSATSLVAVVAVYAPLIVLALKILNLESLSATAGSIFRKPGGA